MKLLTKEQQESYENAKICYIYKEKFDGKYANDKNINKLEIISTIQLNIEVVQIAYIIQSIVYLQTFL